MLANFLLQSVNGFKTFKITANTVDVNLFTLAGSPTKKGRFRFIVNPNVIIGQSNSAVASVVVGQFPSGSQIELINSGSIQGRGGSAGLATNLNGSVGGNGGDCIKVDYLNQIVKIINNGQILAGGGGGGSGGFGGAGGVGGRGNITSTSGFSYRGNLTGWWVHDPGHTDILLSDFPTYSFDSNVSSTPGAVMNGSATRALLPYGINDRGPQAEPYGDDNNGLGPRIVYECRYSLLQPPGANGAATNGGSGGQGRGYNQLQTNGIAGSMNSGNGGSNGAGNGGSSGLSGTGGNGGDWGVNATAASDGGSGTNGTAGTADTFGEAGAIGQSGGSARSSGLAGRAILKNTASVTIINNNTITGLVV